MNFVTSVFKKYINKDEAKTQKNSKTSNDAPGPSTAETSKISELKETNIAAPAPENFSEPQGSALLSEEEDCFQDAQTSIAMPSNIANNHNTLLNLEASSSKGLNITKKVEYLLESKSIKEPDTFDKPQETQVDCQSPQKIDKTGEAALGNPEVNQAAKFVSLNDILFDSSYNFDKALPREDLKPQNEANMVTARSALEVLIQNVNEAFVCTTDTTEKNIEENYKVQIESIMTQENYLDEESSKARKDEEVETQKRKCEDVEGMVKKLKTDIVGVQENIENQNAPDKIVEHFVLKPSVTKDMNICKAQIEENKEKIKDNEITNKFKESSNNTEDNKIIELKPKDAHRFPEENKIKLKTEIEIYSSEQITKTKEEGEDNQRTENSVLESKENKEITDEIMKQKNYIDSGILDKNDNDNQYLKQVVVQNLVAQGEEDIIEEETRSNLNIESVELYNNEKETIAISDIENINDTFVEDKNKEDKLQQGDLTNAPLIQEDSFQKVMLEKKGSSVEIRNQQAQANLESLEPQKENFLSPTKELVNALTNSESINKTSDDKTSPRRDGNKGGTSDLANAPMIQEDSSEKVMLEQIKNSVEIQDQQDQANLERLGPQTDLSPTKESVNSLTNYSKSIHTTSDDKTSLTQEENKGHPDDLVKALMIQEVSPEKVMLEQNKNLEIQDPQAQTNLESSVTQTADVSSTKELVTTLKILESVNKTSDNESSLKQVINKGDNYYALENAPLSQEDSVAKVMLEQNKNSLGIQDQQAHSNLESLVTQIIDLLPTKELVNYSTNSDSINKTSVSEASLKREESKRDTHDLVNAPMNQDVDVKVMLAQNKSLVEIQSQEARANLGSLVAQKEDLSSIRKESVHSSANSKNIDKSDELLGQAGNKDKLQDTNEDFASSAILIREDSSVNGLLEKNLVEVKDLIYQDSTELIKNQDTQIQKNLNTETDVTNQLRELKQSQTNFKLSTLENNREHSVEKIKNDSELVVVCASKSISDTKEENYEQNLQKPNTEKCGNLISIHNYLEKHTKEDEQIITGIKTYDRQDTKEFEKLERECKMNFKSDTTIDELTNFGRQDTQEFENLERKLAINEEKPQSITDDILNELVAESKTDEVCLKFLEKNKTEDDLCVTAPDQANETKISSAAKIKESGAKIVTENKKTFFRQDTLEFEKLEKQCTEVTCLDVLDELVAQSTRDNSISNAELIESIKCELVSTPCKESNENVFEKTIQENKSEQEPVLEASHQNNKTTFLEIHLQSDNAAKKQGENKTHAEEKVDDVKNKLQIQVRSVNNNKQNQLLEVMCQKQKKNKTVDEELKSKVDDLQLELDTIRKMNRRKGKYIATSKVEMEESGNVISKYKNVINKYEKHIVQQNSDLEKLKIENERYTRHFTNTEMAFSDVFEKYEKAKYVVAAYAKNEDILLENLQNAEEQLTKIETKCVAMKEQSFEQIKQAKQHVEQEKQKYNQEIAKLQGQVKRLDIKASSLEVALKQKTDECQALASLCDDITGRNST